MANFCTNCGSKLNENQMCLCQTQPIQEVEKEIHSEVNHSQVAVESDKQSIQVEIDVEKMYRINEYKTTRRNDWRKFNKIKKQHQ